MFIALWSILQSISWSDIYAKLSAINNDELSLYGDGYKRNHSLYINSFMMMILCIALSTINATASLLFFIWRHIYCVDYQYFNRPQSILRTYQTVAVTDDGD
jgi:hypothetical protein